MPYIDAAARMVAPYEDKKITENGDVYPREQALPPGWMPHDQRAKT